MYLECLEVLKYWYFAISRNLEALSVYVMRLWLSKVAIVGNFKTRKIHFLEHIASDSGQLQKQTKRIEQLDIVSISGFNSFHIDNSMEVSSINHSLI